MMLTMKLLLCVGLLLGGCGVTEPPKPVHVTCKFTRADGITMVETAGDVVNDVAFCEWYDTPTNYDKVMIKSCITGELTCKPEEVVETYELVKRR